MLVSIIITTFGGSEKLSRAIQSVLNQTYDDYEVIVVDDNSPNSDARRKTEQIMEQFSGNSNVNYIKHKENRNGAAARNTGVRAAKGTYIAFLDDDDIYLADHLIKASAIMEMNLDVVAVCFSVAFISVNLIDHVMILSDGDILLPSDFIVKQNVIGTGSNIFVRRNAVCSIDGFDEQFTRFQDVEFMIRLSKLGKVMCKPYVTVVKDISDKRVPKYENVKIALELFMDKFHSEISSLSKEDLDMFYKEKYVTLWDLAKISRNKQLVIEAADRAKSLDGLTHMEKWGINHLSVFMIFLKVKFGLKYGNLSWLYDFLKRVKCRNKDKSNKIILGEKYLEIKQIMLKNDEVWNYNEEKIFDRWS